MKSSRLGWKRPWFGQKLSKPSGSPETEQKAKRFWQRSVVVKIDRFTRKRTRNSALNEPFLSLDNMPKKRGNGSRRPRDQNQTSQQSNSVETTQENEDNDAIAPTGNTIKRKWQLFNLFLDPYCYVYIATYKFIAFMVFQAPTSAKMIIMFPSHSLLERN